MKNGVEAVVLGMPHCTVMLPFLAQNFGFELQSLGRSQ